MAGLSASGERASISIPISCTKQRGLSEAEIATRLGIEGGRIEGWLFPDTYLFDKQSSDLELLARAHRVMRKKLDSAWAERDTGLPYRNPMRP